jgi:hypothetical protein
LTVYLKIFHNLFVCLASSGSGLSEKQRSNISEFCYHNGRFSQLFCFSAVRLFGDSNAFLLDEPITMTDFRLFTAKTVLMDEIASCHSSESTSSSRLSVKQRAKNAVTGAVLEMVSMKLPTGKMFMSRNMYDASMRRVLLSETEGKEEIPETLPMYLSADFPVQPLLAPNLDLVHNCYVYPLKADLIKFFSSSKEARGLSQNITVRVTAHDNDVDCSSTLCVFFGKSHESVFVDSVTCAVAIGSSAKALFWYDELKLRLPLNLGSKFHLRFTFLSLHPPSSKDEDNVETVLGWSYLFITPGMQSEQTIRVSFGRKVPNNYIKAAEASGESLGSLAVQIKINSTVKSNS